MEKGVSSFNSGIGRTPTALLILCSLYMFLSYFEIYLPGASGPSTRYLIFILSLLFLYFYKGRIRKNTYIVFILIWFIYKVISVTWSNQSNNDVSRTILSQIGMVLLFSALCGQIHDKKLICILVRVNYFSSFLYGILTLFFHKSYISEVFVARQVLTLFGRQNDPNNCSVFLCIGIAIAAYSLVNEKHLKVLDILVILVNSYGIILTGSRMGFFLLGMVVLMLVLVPNSNNSFIISAFIKKALFVLLIVLLGVWIIERFVPVASLNRMLAFDEYSEGSGRTTKWLYALERIKERPLFGWGWGGYDFIGSALHNTYLTILCDGGIVGLLLFLTPIGKAIYRLLLNKNLLGILLFSIGIVSAFFLDAINKRFFWNTIIIAIMLLENYECTRIKINIWGHMD